MDTPVKLEDHENKEILQKKWLESLGYAHDKSILDCDPSTQTITFKTDDGFRCRRVTECWDRVMGYYRPVSFFNIGKKQEHADRKFFKEPKNP